MKSKLAVLVLVAVCLASKAQADTVVTFSGTNCYSCNPGLPPPFDLEAQLTVEYVSFGTFYLRSHAEVVTGPGYVVEAMTGTYNGEPVSLLPSVTGTPSWLISIVDFGDLEFSAGGANCSLWDDISFSLLSCSDGSGGFLQVTNVATTTPEPGSLLLLAAGLTGLAWRRLRS
jgi:hypothetical protein